jgi:uncharacterized caspase-like protein
LNAGATRGAITTAFRTLVADSSKAGSNAYVIVFLSGHGHVDAKGQYFFCPYEHDDGDTDGYNDVGADFIFERLNEIVNYKRGTATINRTVVLMIDTCHAGAGVGSGATRNFSQPDITSALKNYERYTGIAVYAASRGRELSEENPEWQHGAFTLALLQGLQGKAAGPDGVVFSDKLSRWVEDEVARLTGGRQHPAFWTQPPGKDPFQLYSRLSGAPGRAGLAINIQRPGREGAGTGLLNFEARQRRSLWEYGFVLAGYPARWPPDSLICFSCWR